MSFFADLWEILCLTLSIEKKLLLGCTFLMYESMKSFYLISLLLSTKFFLHYVFLYNIIPYRQYNNKRCNFKNKILYLDIADYLFKNNDELVKNNFKNVVQLIDGVGLNQDPHLSNTNQKFLNHIENNILVWQLRLLYNIWFGNTTRQFMYKIVQ